MSQYPRISYNRGSFTLRESGGDLILKNARTVVLSAIVVSVFVVPFCSLVTAASGQVESVTYNVYFGDLHAHTTYSDAWEGVPSDAYAAAKAGGADFMATTDHHYDITPEEWAATHEMADAATTSDFVAIAAYEYWMPSSGEINVFDTVGFPPSTINPANHGNPGNHGSKWDSLPTFYDWLSQQAGASGNWNHPDYMTKEFYSYAYRTDSRDTGMNMLEIHNYGSWTWKGILSYEDSFVKALDAGWHVMPTASSDTHSPDWITGYPVRTALLAPSLTRANLYEAMSACRGYATLDSNLHIYFALNGAIMGSALQSGTTEFTATISISDPDGGAAEEITLVEIVSDGGQVVEKISTSGTTVDLSVPLSSDSSHYYYLRVTTASGLEGGPGVTAWTAPVWTGR